MEALVSDELWAAVAPLLPPPRPRAEGGRPPVDDRKALAGIPFVLRSGLPWEMLPRETGRGSGMARRRRRGRQEAGAWATLRRALLDRLGAANAIDWSRRSIDSASVPARRGAGPPARTRPTAASRAASGASPRTPAASRSRWS
jgi:transposase